MNPFSELKYGEVDKHYLNWTEMYPKSYNKDKVSPFTKIRAILLNGAEYEANWFLHQFARNCADPFLLKQIAKIRLQEQQQQKRISCLKPKNENVLESTIGYEQLAVELTAILAQREKDENNKKALDFALLEDFDHLYRYANMLMIDYGINADMLVGKFTEIMPGRPTISEHRYPIDNVRQHMNASKADIFSKLVGNIITAAEQQTMNYYMNQAQFYKNDIGRRLFSEIALIEEEHVTQYENLNDPTLSWLEKWVMHEYTECYLYWSLSLDESEEYIKKIYNEHYEMEKAHLLLASQMLEKYENKSYKSVVGSGEFPKPLVFGENIDYVRKILQSVNLTFSEDKYVSVETLSDGNVFFEYQAKLNGNGSKNASHNIIQKSIKKFGKDYRFETDIHPIEELRARKADNVSVGRTK